MVKDSVVDPFQLNTIRVRHRLEIVCQKHQEAIARKIGDNELMRYAVKLLLSKFNS